MNSAFTFWFATAVVFSVVLGILEIAKWAINKFTRRRTNDNYETLEGGFMVGAMWCWMCVFMWIFA